jgi:Uri superfamily endonuclease
MGILMFKGPNARRIYKSLGVKGLKWGKNNWHILYMKKNIHFLSKFLISSLNEKYLRQKLFRKSKHTFCFP